MFADKVNKIVLVLNTLNQFLLAASQGVASVVQDLIYEGVNIETKDRVRSILFENQYICLSSEIIVVTFPT